MDSEVPVCCQILRGRARVVASPVMCYVRRMLRVVRAVTCLALALLVLLQATPTVAKIKMRSASRGCEIVAAKHRVPLLALPSERSGSPVDSPAERTPLVPLSIFITDSLVAALVTRVAVSRGSLVADARAWLHAHRQRARAPDDPDPL